MATTEILDLMAEAEGRPSAVLSQLKRLYGLSDDGLAQAIGINRRSLEDRRLGRTKFRPAEIAGLAAAFELPEQVFFMEPAEATRVVLERNPSLRTPAAFAGGIGPTDQ